MSTSKLQERTGQLLYENFPHLKVYENHRPEWLRGNTLEILELDFYIPERKIAIEVQGRQHYEFVEFFHKDYDKFLLQLERDNIKKDLCYGRKIKLVEIADNFELEIFIKEFYESENKKQSSEEQEIIDERAYRNFLQFEEKTISLIIKYEKTNHVTQYDAATSAMSKLFLFHIKFGYETKNEKVILFYKENKEIIDEKFNKSLKSRMIRHMNKQAA